MLNPKFLSGLQRFGSLALLVIGFSACTGAESTTMKRWENRDTSIKLENVTSQRGELGDAGQNLGLAIEDVLHDSAFVVTDREAHYLLKYKITSFQKGNRWKRMATFGINESARAMLKAKVALYNQTGMLAAWEIESWVNGGPTGGSENSLYEKAASKILAHLRGY